MGLFGFGGKGGKVARLEKKVMNKWGQAFERQRAMQTLAEMRTEESISALLKRFTYRTDGAIADEDEKRAAYELLLDAGELAAGPIERFVGQHDGVYWPLKALKEIVGIDRAVELLLKALDRAEKLSGRVNEQKVQLVSNLRDFPHPLVLERLKQLAHDRSDEVRIMAIDGLLTYGPDEALEVVAERLLDPEESPRLRSVVFEQLVELEWSLARWREALEEREGAIPGHYRLGPKGNVVRAN